MPRAAGQLWVFDITYIPLQESFASLSLITDAYSRKIVGFFLSADLAAIGCIRALGMALATWFQQDYLIHHSDMGLHYCSQGYIKLLKEKGNAISMTQSGDPLENALAERVNGILKEELLKKVYPTFQEAQLAVATAISIYNHQSPHLSINMLTPVQAHGREGDLKRHWKNYYTAIKEQQVPM